MMPQIAAISSEIATLKLNQNENHCKQSLPVLNGGYQRDDGQSVCTPSSLININPIQSNEFRFIDECTPSSSSDSSACSTASRKYAPDDVSNQSDPATLKPSSPRKTPSVSLQFSHVLDELSPPSRHVPSVAVLGYQRALADSIAAAASGDDQTDRSRLLYRTSGLSELNLDLSTHGIDHRLRCGPPQSEVTSCADSAYPPPLPPTETGAAEEELIEAASTDQFSARKKNMEFTGTHSLWTQLMEDKRLSAEDAESIAESVYHQPPKAADRSAAYRLAKRLFTLDGFKITDVAKHLSKRNDFSQLVGEEFASFFDFTDQTIDDALRTFMLKFSLTGESQERERVLFHFSRRYLACNPGSFVSDDACHTLVCGLMLLNTDLHSQSVTRKMSCQEFVTNLCELNRGENQYSREELKRLYNAFKAEPLRWPIVENPTYNLMGIYGPTAPSSSMLPSSAGYTYNGLPGAPMVPQPLYNGPITSLANGSSQYWADSNAFAAWAAAAQAVISQTPPNLIVSCRPSLPSFSALAPIVSTVSTLTTSTGTSNSDPGRRLFSSVGFSPFVDLPKDVAAKEYMRGFVMRKWIMESHGKKTTLGKRGWKLYYARLRDLVLYLYKDAETAAQATRAEEMHLAYVQQVYRMHCQYQRELRYHHDMQQAYAAAASAAAMAASQTHPPPAANPTNGLPCKGDAVPSVGDDEDEDEGFDVDDDYDQVANEPPIEKIDQTVTFPIDAAASVKTAENGLSPSPVPASLPSTGPDDTGKAPTTAKPAASPADPFKLDAVNSNLTFNVPPPPPPAPPPETVICIAHAFALPAEDYTKKSNVFRLKTKDGKEFLFQVNDPKELELWVDKINFVAGLLSAPSLPSAVGSERTFYRPVLPSGVTNLNMHEQLEDHQKRVIDLTRDLTELKRRKLSAPSQPNLHFTSRDFAAPSKPRTKPEPTIPSDAKPGELSIANQINVAAMDDAKNKAVVNSPDKDETAVASQLQAPPSPYIPDSVIKSLQSPLAATLPSSATTSNSSLNTVFSTASLGRRRKRSLRNGGSEWNLAAQQRAEFDECMKYLEDELTRYKTYSRLLEADICRMQRMAPGFGQPQQFYAPSAHPFLPGRPMSPAGGYYYQQGPPLTPQGGRWLMPSGQSVDQSVLVEEPPVVVNGDGGTNSHGPQQQQQQQPAHYPTVPNPQSLPPSGPLGKRVYGPFPTSPSPYGGMRQASGSRMHRNYHHRGYQMRQKQQQQQQFLNPALGSRQNRVPLQVPSLLASSQHLQSPPESESDQQPAASLYEVF